MKYWSLLIVVGMALDSAWGAAANPSVEALTFLRQRLDFSSSELEHVRRGNAVTKRLRTEKQEVAAFGIVRINAPRKFFLTRFRDIEAYKKSAAVPQVRKFSDPPQLEDVEGLVFNSEDMKAIQECRVAHCGIKLPADAMARFQREVDWSARNIRERVTAIAKQMLLDYVRAYIAGGNAALAGYDDKEHPLRLAEEFTHLLERSPYLYEYAPEFHEYLRDFPSKRLVQSDDFIYWSEERYGHNLKPVLTVTHVSIYQPDDPRAAILIASKQIYASHYFEASLGLTSLAAASPDPEEPSFYLMYLNRSRFDVLRGWYSGLVRNKISSAMGEAMRENMELTKRRIEALYRARSGVVRSPIQSGAPASE